MRPSCAVEHNVLGLHVRQMPRRCPAMMLVMQEAGINRRLTP
jgi:hypothetical protein